MYFRICLYKINLSLILGGKPADSLQWVLLNPLVAYNGILILIQILVLAQWHKPFQMNPSILCNYIRYINAVLSVFTLHLHLRIDNVHCIHRHTLHAAIDNPLILGTAQSIYQIISNKSQYSDIIIYLPYDFLFLGSIKVHNMDLFGFIEVLAFLPCKPAGIAADSIASLCQPLGHYQGFIALEIDTVHSTLKHNIHHVILAEIGQFINVCFHHIIGFRCRQEELFLYRILFLIIVVIYHSHPSFVLPPVHISIHQKIHRAVILHGQYLYVVPVIIASHTVVRIASERKYAHRLLIIIVIAPQISSCFKCHILGFWTLHGSYFVVICNSKKNLFT